MEYPGWRDEARLLAKSTEMGGQTLARHTWDVLARLSDQVRLRPELPGFFGERLWHRLYWACFLHDFGKAAPDFQGVLRHEQNQWKVWRQRHEVLSLGFVDWLFPRDHPDRDWVVAVIVSHHKDIEVIFDKYGGDRPFKSLGSTEQEEIERLIQHLAGQIDAEMRTHLWQWIDECAVDWAAQLGIPLMEKPALVPLNKALEIDLERSVFRALRTFADWHKQMPEEQKCVALLSRGLIFTADHSASAGAEPFPDMPLNRENAKRPLGNNQPRHHQTEARDAPPGSAIMIAPTGSGKTEAAMMWAAQQITYRPTARLFYTLPYQASMNAMYERIATRFLDEKPEDVHAGKSRGVTIQHSRALLKLYQDMMEVEERDPRQVKKDAERLRNLAKLNFFPIQVFSPYQMLKAAYSLKGYETLLLDYTNALFIFDEIHAYEAKRLALMITMMQWLVERYRARFLVMTATLPPMALAKLKDALGVEDGEIIRATAEEFERSQRHTVHLLEGRLSDQIVEHIRADWAGGKVVLVCLNRVADAQKVYNVLKDDPSLNPDQKEIVLLHGRFNGKDRREKERTLQQMAPVGWQRSGAKRQPFVMVATQVVEVSLDVDFDTIYTDPAPLEALIQRFGRVNRGRQSTEGTMCPVYVFCEPSSTHGKAPYKPYDENIVKNSIAVLRNYCGGGRPIDESRVNAMLEEIYQGAAQAAWEAEYKKSADKFRHAILDQMTPFKSADKEMYGRFYEMFDGIEVLPKEYDDAYAEAKQRSYLEASQYLVNISAAQYGEFNGYGFILHARELEGEYADYIDVPYSWEFGLDLDGAREAHKLKIEDEE